MSDSDMMEPIYYTPLDLGAFLRVKSDVAGFFEYAVKELNILCQAHRDEEDFIPPVVYVEIAKSFNIDYNFLIKCLARWGGFPAIEGDFKLTEDAPRSVIDNGRFLIVGILEQYYQLARINNPVIKLSKYRSKHEITVEQRFYNVVCMQNLENIKRFSAVPFSASALKSLVDENSYSLLEKHSKNNGFVQVAFGIKDLRNLVQKNGNFPAPVFV